MYLGSSFTDVLPATLLLITFAVIGGVIIYIVRKNMKSTMSFTATFTLKELRLLRDNGSMSEEEFQKAKDSIIKQTL